MGRPASCHFPLATSHLPMSLIELQHIDKTYRLGERDVPVLKAVSLQIRQGEFVALMGASGSGKTTLMNLLGCLDQPTSGSYRFDDCEVGKLSRHRLAQLRSSRIGFVFQSFNLMPRATALENVRMPTAYAGNVQSRMTNAEASHRHSTFDIRLFPSASRQRARELLKMVGLESRVGHTPAKLSGGEQQRVAIARALINRPILLLADEPTGNLDSRTGKEILELFRRLNVEQGITILLVTHDLEVARFADRLIRIADGRITDDSSLAPAAHEEGEKGRRGEAERQLVSPAPLLPFSPSIRARGTRRGWRVAAGAVRIALQALRRNVMRTLLTMLGVIIGVAAVIAMMETSRGATAAIQLTVAKMGADTLTVTPGVPKGGAERYGTRTDTLMPDDADAIARECPSAVAAAPVVNAWGQVVYGNHYWNTGCITGSTADFLKMRNWNDLEFGRVFNERELRAGDKVCLLGKTLVQQLFGGRYPVGEEIRVKNVPFRVIGVLSEKGANLLGTDQDDIIFAPWTTVRYRLNGQGSGGSGVATTAHLLGTPRSVRSESVGQIMVQAKSTKVIPRCCREITRLLRYRHHAAADESDFRIYDNAEVSNVMKKVVQMLSGLGLSVAAVSLIVGGVGIMNIMLVSVTERTREIGLRMAVGANAFDILVQFLVEAVVLCLTGGFIGIVAGRTSSMILSDFLGWPTKASVDAAAIAVAVSVLVGVVFGFYPAWKASRLNPIDALRYE